MRIKAADRHAGWRTSVISVPGEGGKAEGGVMSLRPGWLHRESLSYKIKK